jgi:hypothetical protein
MRLIQRLTDRRSRTTAFVAVAALLAALAAGCSSGAAMGAAGPCPNPAAVSTGGIGAIHVGMTVTAAEKAYPSVTRGRTDMRFFCEQGVGPRAGFPTTDGLDTVLTAAQQHTWNGRIVFVSSSNRDVDVLGIHPGDVHTGPGSTDGLPNALVKKAVLGSPFEVGSNWWWVVPYGHGIDAEFKMQLNADRQWQVGEAGFVPASFFSTREAGQMIFTHL